jgi:hypothetical protein
MAPKRRRSGPKRAAKESTISSSAVDPLPFWLWVFKHVCEETKMEQDLFPKDLPF